MALNVHDAAPAPAPGLPNRKRGGRPSAENAGEAERRILDAATTLFLRAGFDATSCDQVLALAGAGKATLYARYANKDALFGATVRRLVDQAAPPTAEVRPDMPLRERLRAAGHGVLAQALAPQSVALMRMCVATAHRLPELAQLVAQTDRAGAMACVVHALTGGEPAPARSDAALALAGRFIDMVLAPQQMRALLGDDGDRLAAAAPRRIDDAIDLLARAGALDAFEAGA